jgi:hypothetical protein
MSVTKKVVSSVTKHVTIGVHQSTNIVHYDSVRREVLYNILIDFGVPMKLVRLIKMCLKKT